MGAIHDSLSAKLGQWLTEQPMFFVATAPLSADGHVNVSPRGQDCFSVLGPNRVAWVDYTGSGAETIAHLRENGRICVMFCSIGTRPNIVRLHGTGRVALPGESEFDQVAAEHPGSVGIRAVIVVDVHRVAESCGWGVPQMDVIDTRDILPAWAEKKGTAGVAAYQSENNRVSIDGLPALPNPSGA